MAAPPRPHPRPGPWLVVALLVAAGLALVLLRRPLVAAALTAALRAAGAGEVTLAVTHAAPGRIEIERLGFRVRTRRFEAARVRLEREAWWRPSLGEVHVADARLRLAIDGSDTNPWAWSTYGTPVVVPRIEDLRVPADVVRVDGVVVVESAGQPAHEVRVDAEARRGVGDRWSVRAAAAGPGLRATFESVLDRGAQALEFRLTGGSMDLAVWQGHLQSLVVLPGGRWIVGGRIEGEAAGRWTKDALTAQGRLRLSEGRIAYPPRAVVVEGVQAEIELTDLPGLVSAPSRWRAAELRVGTARAVDLEAEVALAGKGKVAVAGATLAAFGGRLVFDPFVFHLGREVLEAGVRLTDVAIADLLALAPSVPARVTGRVGGTLSFRVDYGGLRLGRGRLELVPGRRSELRFESPGLLARSGAPFAPGPEVRRRLESGTLGVELTELRLDIRPPDLPAGRSALLRVAGTPADPDVRDPVRFQLEIPGPIEALLQPGPASRFAPGAPR